MRAGALLLSVIVAVAALASAVASAQPGGHANRGDFDAYIAANELVQTYAAFEEHLRAAGVDGVVPAWTLWRQGTDWRSLGEPAFAEPPQAAWPGIVPTLAALRDDVVPITGPVEVVSGWRTDRYNRRAGGAPASRHRNFEAVDVVPSRPWERPALHTRLLELWRVRGPELKMGLGLYSGTRFHVDTHRHRRW